ncbi:MAG: DNA-binding protein [Actinophytocola sp.]|nr:DNA-binding protein [Actinophytocola sp.]
MTADSLSAPYTVEFPFERTVGPKIGTFLGGLRDGRLYGAQTERGVLCPPLEFEPETGAETGKLVPVADTGTVTSWTWVPSRPGDPVPHDFAWALIAIDGTTGALFHAVDVDGDSARMATGMRVRARWRAERVGQLSDIECFEVAP